MKGFWHNRIHNKHEKEVTIGASYLAKTLKTQSVPFRNFVQHANCSKQQQLTKPYTNSRQRKDGFAGVRLDEKRRGLSAIYFQRGPESEYLNSSIVMRFVAPASLNGAGVVSTSEQSLTPEKKQRVPRGHSTCHAVENARPVAVSRNDSSPPVCAFLFPFFLSFSPLSHFSSLSRFFVFFRLLSFSRRRLPTFDRFLGAFSGNIKMPRRVVRTTISSVGAPDVPWIPGVRS